MLAVGFLLLLVSSASKNFVSNRDVTFSQWRASNLELSYALHLEPVGTKGSLVFQTKSNTIFGVFVIFEKPWYSLQSPWVWQFHCHEIYDFRLYVWEAKFFVFSKHKFRYVKYLCWRTETCILMCLEYETKGKT